MQAAWLEGPVSEPAGQVVHVALAMKAARYVVALHAMQRSGPLMSVVEALWSG